MDRDDWVRITRGSFTASCCSWTCAALLLIRVRAEAGESEASPPPPQPAPRKQRKYPTPPAEGGQAAIREWCRDNGIPVNDRGTIPGRIREQYLAAHATTNPA